MSSRLAGTVLATLALAGGGVAAAAAATAGHHPSPAAPCTSIRATLGQSSGAAGSTYQKIRFTNTGSATCTIVGHPGVRYVNIHKIMVGWPAAPANFDQLSQAQPAVTLPPGQTATATLQLPDYQNFAPVDCLPYNARSLRVIVNGQVTYLTWNQTECTTQYGRSHIGRVTG